MDRIDKFMDYSSASLMVPERAAEFKRLLDLSKLLFFLPFEINKKAALNLQVSEQFCALFMDHNHGFVKRRAESTFGSMDTGIKIGMIFNLWSDDSKGQISLYKQEGLRDDQT